MSIAKRASLLLVLSGLTLAAGCGGKDEAVAKYSAASLGTSEIIELKANGKYFQSLRLPKLLARSSRNISVATETRTQRGSWRLLNASNADALSGKLPANALVELKSALAPAVFQETSSQRYVFADRTIPASGFKIIPQASQ